MKMADDFHSEKFYNNKEVIISAQLAKCKICQLWPSFVFPENQCLEMQYKIKYLNNIFCGTGNFCLESNTHQGNSFLLPWTSGAPD